MLEVTGLHKRLGVRKVLDGVAFACAAGETAIVTGENGAGKSTLLRAVVGILAPDRGDVLVRGVSMRRDASKAKQSVGYVPDATDAFSDLIVSELLALVQSLKRARTDDALLDRFAVRPLLRQRVSSLSFGQRKRAFLVAALAGDPPLLVLDEPSNGIDPAGVAAIGALVAERRAKRKSTLLSTNDAPFAASLDAASYHLHDGALSRRR